MAEFQDNLTEKGANRVAERVKGHWRIRGYDVKVWVELADPATRKDIIANGQAVYAVRSDMVNGLPRKMLEARHYNRVIHAV